jgi:DnaJ like chaperone protein
MGKIILSLIGLCLWGADGFMWGMFLGHILIDKSILNQAIKNWFSRLDDNLRLIIPYKGYAVLDILELPFNNKYYNRFRRWFDIFWDRNLIKILGAIIGFSLHSKTLIFAGIIIGYFIDSYTLERGLKNKTIIKYWRKINPLKLALTSKEARHRAFITAMASISAKICKSTGKISENEVNTFNKLFNIEKDKNAYLADIFYNAGKSRESVDRYAYQLKLITEDILELKENIIENLFKIASADGEPIDKSIALLEKVSIIIDLPKGNFEMIRCRFFLDDSRDSYQILGIAAGASNEEIKQKWKELITLHHPDKVQAAGGSVDAIHAAGLRMAKINNAYQSIMKSRNIKG